MYIAPEIVSKHTWDAGEITKQASCLEAGVKTFTCTVCGQTKTESIDALAHNYTDLATKLNSDEKIVKLSSCSVGNEKTIRVAMNQISGAFNTSKSSAEGEPEAFALGAAKTLAAADEYKLDKNVAIAFKVNVSAPITGAKLYAGAKMSSGHENRCWYNMAIAGNETNTSSPDAVTEDGYRLYCKVNDGAFTPINPEGTFGTYLGTSQGKYFPVGTFDLVAGENIIYIRQGNLGYRLTLGGELRIVFNGDQTLTGEDYVPPHEHTWGAAQTAIGDAIPHECSGCHGMCYELAIPSPAKLKVDVVWNVTGLPAGTYEVEIEACGSSSTLKQNIRTGTNANEAGRYQFRFGDGDAVYVDPTAGTYGSFGLGEGESADKVAWSKPLCQVTADEGAAKFEIHWTDKGYSVFIKTVRLVKVA